MAHPQVVVTNRCYLCNARPVAYEACLDYDLTPVIKMCAECLAFERADESVVWARSVSR